MGVATNLAHLIRLSSNVMASLSACCDAARRFAPDPNEHTTMTTTTTSTTHATTLCLSGSINLLAINYLLQFRHSNRKGEVGCGVRARVVQKLFRLPVPRSACWARIRCTSHLNIVLVGSVCVCNTLYIRDIFGVTHSIAHKHAQHDGGLHSRRYFMGPTLETPSCRSRRSPKR